MAGKYYEELEIGQVYKHECTRTVTEMDNVLFSCLTMNTQPLHIDEEFATKMGYPGRLVNGLFTAALLGGMTVSDLTLGTTLGNLAFREIKHLKPVFHGDTLRAETRVVAMRESKSRPEAGIVTFVTYGYNQRNEAVMEMERTQLILRKQKAGAGA